MVDNMKRVLAGKKIDFLFIDGDHSYEGVKKDFENYRPLVSNGGCIGLHDIASNKLGVIDFWNEIKPLYKHKEIVETENPEPAGIGLIYF